MSGSIGSSSFATPLFGARSRVKRQIHLSGARRGSSVESEDPVIINTSPVNRPGLSNRMIQRRSPSDEDDIFDGSASSHSDSSDSEFKPSTSNAKKRKSSSSFSRQQVKPFTQPSSQTKATLQRSSSIDSIEFELPNDISNPKALGTIKNPRTGQEVAATQNVIKLIQSAREYARDKVLTFRDLHKAIPRSLNITKGKDNKVTEQALTALSGIGLANKLFYRRPSVKLNKSDVRQNGLQWNSVPDFSIPASVEEAKKSCH